MPCSVSPVQWRARGILLPPKEGRVPRSTLPSVGAGFGAGVDCSIVFFWERSALALLEAPVRGCSAGRFDA